MKTLRRFLPCVLILALCLSLAGTAAASDFSPLVETKAQYSSTQSFLDALDSYELDYEYGGLSENGDERVYFDYPGDYCEDILIAVIFSPDEDDVYLRVWNLIDFDSADYRELLGKINELNSGCYFGKFLLDSTDYSVTIELDSLLPEDGGLIVLQYLIMLGDIADDAYNTLLPYAK